MYTIQWSALHITSLHALLIPGVIEFRTFVQETEKELLALFESIDRNNDHKLSKEELQVAFRTFHCTTIVRPAWHYNSHRTTVGNYC